MASSTTLVGEKFQHRDVTNVSQWTNVKDYRFRAGDTVSLYRLQQSSTGTLAWDWNEDRTLQGATALSSIFAVASLLSVALLTF